MKRRVDPFTLAVMLGHYSSIVREMSITMGRTARTVTFKVGKDFSNAIFDKGARLILQGEDELPVHVGASIITAREIANHFADNIYPGDVIIHNDPATGGTHLEDMAVIRPIFYKDEVMFWALCRAHMVDTGGMTVGGYHPLAEEIYQEGIRIPPIKLYEKGEEKKDLLNLYLANVRFPEQIEADLRAEIAATAIAEREFIRLLDKYGKAVVEDSIEDILDVAERRMRAFIAGIRDGVYHGSCMLHGDGRGSGDKEIKATVTVKGDELRVDLDSPKQLRNYTNCYAANVTAMAYLGIISHMKVELPLNEGSYRPITVYLGPEGTITNAAIPAACSLSTSIANAEIQAAVRMAMSQAVPENAHADWSHTPLNHPVGVDPRTGKPYTFWLTAGAMGGAGAVRGSDGWPAIGSPLTSGAGYYADIEGIEYEFPLMFILSEFRADSGGAGKWRGGLAVDIEIGPVNSTMDLVAAGVGDKFFAAGVAGAKSRLIEPKLHRRYLIGKKGISRIQPHTIAHINIGEKVRLCPQGGGGVGDPFQRDPEMVRWDVINGIVSVQGAEEEYGVVIDPESFQIDYEATRRRRRGKDEI